MSISTLLILALGLAMDAFAVSVCKGLAIKKVAVKHALWVGLWFGGFQGLMPVIGYLLGVQFKDKIEAVDHWIGFVLLVVIGANMIKESFGKEEGGGNGGSLTVKSMFVLAIATSIDALAVGITLAFLEVKIAVAATSIGIITFFMSGLGVKIGNVFGIKYKSKAELAGGGILILLGTKILLEHLGIF